MPIAAVGVALAVDAFAGAAVAGGIALSAAATTFAVVGAVGATLGAIGSVTRNKTLTMVGGAIGAVGAIGGLASAAGLFSAAGSSGSAFGAAASDASSAATYGSTAGEFGAAASSAPEAALSVGEAASAPTISAASGAADTLTAGTGDTIGELSAQLGAGEANTIASEAANATDPAMQVAQEGAKASGGFLDNSGLTDQFTGFTQSENAIPTPGVDTNATWLDQLSPATAGTANGPIEGGALQVGALGTPDKSSSIFGSILDFAKNNQLVTFGALQVGGSLLKGLTDTTTPAQINAANAQANANNAAAKLTQQQTANLALPKATATSSPVTGAPSPILPTATATLPSAGGFLNAAPRLAPVTGAVAA